ncbi:MAG TPA: ATP-binding protein [Candidatus Dormibacteraeota bacterium]|nr:ATP-binding protein [Candidatus Dormibacteraeota bacterium]
MIDASRDRSRGSVALAWGLAIVAVALGVTALALGVVNLHSDVDPGNALPLDAPFPFGLGLIGGFIAWQRRRNPIGWILLFAALGMGLTAASSGYGVYAGLARHGTLPGAAWALWLYSLATIPVYPCGAVALLLLLLPRGRLLSARWRPVAWAGVALSLFFLLLTALGPPYVTGPDSRTPRLPNPVAVLPLFESGQHLFDYLVSVLYVLAVLILVASAASLLLRVFRATGDEREQVRWIAYVVGLTAIGDTALSLVSVVSPGQQEIWNVLTDLVSVLGFGLGLPVATAVAIFKYRLYDIDLIISRTLVFGALAVFITAVYVGIAVGIGDLVGSNGQPNLGLSILATAIVAVGFEPLRGRLQRLANHLVYGPRANPYEILSEFSERVAASYAAEDVVPRMARVLADGTGAERAAVWLRSGAQLRPAAVWPTEWGAGLAPLPVTGQLMPAIPEADRTVAVRHQGELLGALSVRKRAGESLSTIEVDLLDDLANQAGLVLRNVGLTTELVRRLRELEGSRRRLLAAQDAERRRIERDLQEGAQRNVIALRERLGETRALAGTDPARTGEMIAGLMAEADEALQTLRELARGIYPPLLADRGLEPAIEAHLRRVPAAATASIEATAIGRYPREIEAGVYFCVLEALANVRHHAHATCVHVRLLTESNGLRFEVRDDGCGFDPETATRGGLTNIADRLDALEGRLQIDSALGSGTRLIGTVPIPGPATVPA